MRKIEPHVIRLRGPWEYEPLVRLRLGDDRSLVACEDSLPPAGNLTMPSDWGGTLGRDFRGRVRYSRRFGRPTNLEPGQRVWLVCHGADLEGHARLNDQHLGEIVGYASPTRFDITDRLDERNLLVVDVELPPLGYQAERALRPDRAGLPGGLIGEVRLEIEPATTLAS